ncbi:hypothetical protein GBA52_017596 [Prunus armeniaca]|nr:hypothetical protein GBA52_017596 [Prunus armeniaca]
MMTAVKTEGETQEKALNEVYELLKVLEEGIKSFYPDGIPTFEAENLSLLEVVASSILCPFKAPEEILGIKVIDPEITPLLFSWVEALRELPLVQETIPSHEKIVALLGTLHLQHLQIEESEVPRMCLELYREYGTTMTGLKVKKIAVQLPLEGWHQRCAAGGGWHRRCPAGRK